MSFWAGPCFLQEPLNDPCREAVGTVLKTLGPSLVQVPLTPGAPAAPYQFDKFSRALEVPEYSDEEYARCLQEPRWSREETDHLLTLARQYDLRFIIMADRWGLDRSRSVEEMKERYYGVARQLLLARAHDEDDVADHPLVKVSRRASALQTDSLADAANIVQIAMPRSACQRNHKKKSRASNPKS